MALKLRVTPDRGSYRPGDTLAAMVEVCTQDRLVIASCTSAMRTQSGSIQVVTEQVTGAVQAATTHLEALQLELSAVERVDVNWISPKYRTGSQILDKDARRVGRPLFTMQPVKLCEHTTLLPGSRRLYMVK